MRTKLFLFTLSIILLFAQSSILFANTQPETQPPTQQAQQDWSSVRAISSGEKLSVEIKTGERIEGKLSDTSDSGLTVISKKRNLSINRIEIRTIHRLRTGSRLKSALIGAGVGAGAGAGIGYLIIGPNGSDSAAHVLAGSVIASTEVGAILGLIAGAGSKRTLIYESK